jgi:dTDP-4-amino-4,6-dideoxygalactose transaminase
MPEIGRLAILDAVRPAYHLYVVILRIEELSRSRDEILDALQKENIGIGVHFRALHLQPFYRDSFGFQPGQLPVAEHATDRILSLPLYPAMTDGDVADTIAAVTKVIAHSRRSAGVAAR